MDLPHSVVVKLPEAKLTRSMESVMQAEPRGYEALAEYESPGDWTVDTETMGGKKQGGIGSSSRLGALLGAGAGSD